jgi:hypothetical protein
VAIDMFVDGSLTDHGQTLSKTQKEQCENSTYF